MQTPSPVADRAKAGGSAHMQVRRRQAIGLLLIAGILLIVILLRAPAHLLFPPGWWRP